MVSAFRVAFLAALLPATVFGKARRATVDEPFQLYAYGPNIGGLPVFFSKSMNG